MTVKLNRVVFSITGFLSRLVFSTVYRLTIEGLENLPLTGKLILCSNHTTWMDPFFYCGYLPRPAYFMGKDTAFSNPVVACYLRSLGIFPVARGKRDQVALDTACAILERGDVLGMFPEGTRVKDGRRVSAKKGVGIIAVTANAPVIPVHFYGTFKLFSKVKCTFGKPYYVNIDRAVTPDSQTYRDISNEVLDRIYALT